MVLFFFHEISYVEVLRKSKRQSDRQREEREHAMMEKVVRGRGRTEGNPRSG